MPSGEDNRSSILWAMLLLLPVGLAVVVARDFSGPLMGGGDTDLWEYCGYYVRENLHFSPFPQLDFLNDQTFYPYGVSNVFNAWGFERDLCYAVLSAQFGRGPWLQIYFLISIAMTAAGFYALLRPDFGRRKAALAALLATAFNFYALEKYPYHLNISVAHWAILGIVADFVIVRRAVLRRNLSLRLILLRVCLLLLSLGLDLGYIAGFGLLSLTVSMAFVVLLLLLRWRRKPAVHDGGGLRRLLARYRGEAAEHPLHVALLAALGVGAAYLYVPLVAQTISEAARFDFGSASQGWWWANPARLLLPYLPGLGPRGRLEAALDDSPEAFGAGTVGWFLLIVGLVGLWRARRMILAYVPLLVVLAMTVAYHPAKFPILKLFPWFVFHRVAPRSTVIYPAILALFALSFSVKASRPALKWAAWGILILLGASELCTAYAHKITTYRPYKPGPSFYAYMRHIRSRPGEAILDWPFCVVGGNGIGGDENLAPYYGRNNHVAYYRWLHGKKTVGQYFGRLHPRQIQPFLRAGWQHLFMPDRWDVFTAKRQRQPFDEKQWRFFAEFFRCGDFAGISLCVDLLPQEDVEEFHRRFGLPSAETEMPGAGRVQFIPKPAALRSFVDVRRARDLRFTPPLRWNVLGREAPFGAAADGLKGPCTDETGSLCRRTKNRDTTLSFHLSLGERVVLEFEAASLGSRRDLYLRINDAPAERSASLESKTTIRRRIEFQGEAGANRVVFQYRVPPGGRKNGKGTRIKFLTLTLSADGHGPRRARREIASP